MFSRFFIDRPVFSSVLAIVILLAGAAAFNGLPVEQYPEIVPPEVSVEATYPGASSDVIAQSVAAPLEQSINGVENMLYMTSSSSDAGTLRMSVTFRNGTDPDQATIDVNNRVQQALAQLPQDVRNQGVVVKKKSSSLLMVIAVLSPSRQFDTTFISNYALLNIIDDLKRVQGVGDAALFGQSDYSMRIWMQPDKLAQFNLTPSEVAEAIRAQSAQFAAGKFGGEPTMEGQAFTYTITTDGRFTNEQQFRDIVLRSNETGGTLRLGDVARIELGSKNYGFSASFNGSPMIPIGIYLQPGANALDTVDNIRAKVDELSRNFPGDLSYEIPLDTTDFVRVSIKEVIKTFLEALVLVVLVIFIFLQKPRATIIPLLAIPVAIVGTLAGLFLVGFSINLLTLFGMVLAIGIVVDDAIIVIENVERLMTQEKLDSRSAAIKAMEQVTGPIVATTLVLLAVFVPVAFIPGLAGEMYRQFAVAISIAVLISAIIALTLTPALCNILLRHEKHGEPRGFFRLFNVFFAGLTHVFMGAVRFFLNLWPVGLLLFGGVIAATAYLFLKAPTSLVPPEDQGYFIAVPTLAEASSLNRSIAVRDELSALMLQNPEVFSAAGFAGFDLLAGSLRPNTGVFFVRLNDWSERTAPGQDVSSMVGKVMKQAFPIEDARTFAFVPPPIRGISTTGGFELYLQNRTGGTTEALATATRALVEAAAQRPELTGVRSTFAPNVPHYRAEIDRDKAYALGVQVKDIYAAMQASFGSMYVNDFALFGRNFQVNLAADADFRAAPEDLKRIFVRNEAGQMIPLDSVVRSYRILGPDIVDRFNIFPAAKILGNPAPGYSSGQALTAMQELAESTLGPDYALGWIGAAYQELSASTSGNIAFVFGLLMVFLILAAQYERWSLPFAVVTAVPFGVLGALIAIYLRDLSIDIYFQVGLLVLIGLSAKNAILIVEFAAKLHGEGLSIKEAALEAARIRFRPVIMTSMAFILGVLPLALATGAGEGARNSLGTGIVGGMILATYVAILFVPMFFELIQTLSERLRRQPPPSQAA
ncbi:MAG: multidrug efflux RND transporter permease subunit [Halothiobacillaceae bacterium]|nr:multidrug efflux RND transporter permease subunit [Halothiobacillaceae bacterium]